MLHLDFIKVSNLIVHILESKPEDTPNNKPTETESSSSRKSSVVNDDLPPIENKRIIPTEVPANLEKKWDFNDDLFNFNFAGKTEVTQKLTDVEEDDDEGEDSLATSICQNSNTDTTEKPSKWIWDQIYKYNNPCADQIADIIK